jgi:ABC-type sugar transport system permease subunit
MSARKDNLMAYLFLLPACLLLGMCALWPLLQLIFVSLNHSMAQLQPAPTKLGLCSNYLLSS